MEMGKPIGLRSAVILPAMLVLATAGVVRAAGTTIVLGSVTVNGVQANQGSTNPSISANGRYVAFQSTATNLVPNDTNGKVDVFVKDVTSGNLVCASVYADGSQLAGSEVPKINGNGRCVVFQSDIGFSGSAIRVKDLETGTLAQANTSAAGVQANGPSGEATISADGRYVAFWSYATNLVANDTNNQRDIFVKDLTTGSILRANLSATGTAANDSSYSPSLSGNGRYVAFVSAATTLVPGVFNAQWDVFVKDLVSGAIVRANVSAGGAQANRSEGFPEPSLSADGRYVAFQSSATNLVPGDTNGLRDVFVKDLNTGAIVRATVTATGEQVTQDAYDPEISGDGLHVVFRLGSFVDGSTSAMEKDLVTGELFPIATALNGAPENSGSGQPSVNADGGHIAFISSSTNLVPNDVNARTDVFVSRGDPLVGAPIGLTAQADSSVRVDVNWVDNFSNESGYEVWVSTDGSPFSLLTTRARNVQYFRHSGFSGSHTFTYQVRAIYGLSVTEFSNTATAIVLAQPLGLNSQALNSGQIKIKWNDNATNEAAYEIWRGVGGGALSLLHTAPANTPQYTDSTVTANETYTYQVRCRNGVHVSSPTNTDTSPAMLAPTSLSSNAVSSTQVDLTWTDNSAGLETSFQIFRRLGTGTFKLIGTTGANVTSYSDTAAQPGRSYEYRVRAASGNDWSSFSNSLPITTP
jgi:hypothetical protein